MKNEEGTSNPVKENENQATSDTTYLKGFLITLILAVIVFVYILLSKVLCGLEHYWVGFTALTIWGACGGKFEEMPNIYIGALVGLLIACSLWWIPAKISSSGFGISPIWGIILSLLVIIFIVAGLISEKFQLVCNSSTLIFLNVFTAHHYMTMKSHLNYLPDIFLGAVCFWFIPVLVRMAFNKIKLKNEEVKV